MDGRLNAPNITLELHRTSDTLSTTQPYRFKLVLRRHADSHDGPCTLFWNVREHGFSQGHFELLHKTEAGFEKVDVDVGSVHGQLKDTQPTVIVTKHHSYLNELPLSGEKTFGTGMGEHCQRVLIPGEVYQLNWAGAVVDYWAWGSIEEVTSEGLEYRGFSAPTPERLFLPAAEGFMFSVKEEDEPWPDRAEKVKRFGYNMANCLEEKWRERQAQLRFETTLANNLPKPEERKISDPGAPIFHVKLEAPSQMIRGEKFRVKVHITLQGNDHEPSSATFHTALMYSAFRLARLRNQEGEDPDKGNIWEPCPSQIYGCSILADGDDVRVNVSQHEDFVSVHAGEEWTYEYTLFEPNGEDVPADTVLGDRFRVWFIGMELDWWDWGSAEEHVDTEVSLPSYIGGRVTYPKNTGGRPKAQLTASDPIEITVKG